MMHVAIVGGGQAAASLSRKMRLLGFDGAISIFCEEPVTPYERPPLSKAYLLGGISDNELAIFPDRFYRENAIDLHLSARVEQIDPEGRTLLAGGKTTAYDQLVLATGARARTLPSELGRDLDGIYTLRTLADAEALRAQLRSGCRSLIIGGGYIGLETAAVAAERGLSVTVVELGERILQRVASQPLSDAVLELHKSKGIEIKEGIGVAGLFGDGKVESARLSDGSMLEVELVIVGTGAAPNTMLAESAGLKIDNGIWTDAFGKTSADGIWATGDCASFPKYGSQIRLESFQNAIDQSENVAANIMGREQPYRPTPTFWSDQFDWTVQIVGLGGGGNSIVTRMGEPVHSKSIWIYGSAGLQAVEVVNDPKTFSIARRIISEGKSPSPELIKDASTNLKALLRA